MAVCYCLYIRICEICIFCPCPSPPRQVRGLSGLVSACRAEWAGYGAEGGFLPQLLLVATQVTRDVSSSAKDNAFLLMQ